MTNNIPFEVLEHLFLNIDHPSDLFKLRAVCKNWHHIITNERFLNLYFYKRFGISNRKKFQWILYRTGSVYRPLPDYNIQYPPPAHLVGTGGIVLDSSRHVYRTDRSIITFPLIKHDYSVVMWLQARRYFEKMTFEIQYNDFFLQLTVYRKHVEVSCSNVDRIQAKANIKVPIGPWFHITLTYSDKFQFYLNGYCYPLISIEEPFVERSLGKFMWGVNNNGHMIIDYEGYIKFLTIASCSDIQILPCALSQYEVNAIVKQKTCVDGVNMAQYLLDGWDQVHSYWNYLNQCVLF